MSAVDGIAEVMRERYRFEALKAGTVLAIAERLGDGNPRRPRQSAW
ncbi:MAG: hypothetical protein AAF721_24100 [Myxococcota bacterium]